MSTEFITFVLHIPTDLKAKESLKAKILETFVYDFYSLFTKMYMQLLTCSFNGVF